jgi:hypothetical protein
MLEAPLNLRTTDGLSRLAIQATGNVSGELRAFYGPAESTVGAMDREERQQRFVAMVEYVDKLVGRVSAQLDAS